MDLDVIAKHMPGLLEFKKRIEALLEGAEDGLGSVADAIKAEITEIRSHLSDTADAVSSLQKLKDDVETTISTALSSVDAKIATATAGISAEIDAKFAPFADLASWIAENKQALEVLLSIGDDLAPKPDPAPEPVAEPAPVEEPVVDPAVVDPAAPADQSTI